MSELLARRLWVIQQRKEWGEIITGLELTNKYEILSEEGDPIGYLAEEGSGLLHILKRIVLKSHRPFTALIFDASGSPAIRIRRPWYWFFSSTYVEGADRRPLGEVHRRFRLLSRRYDIRDASGGIAGGVEAGFFRIWTFDLVDAAGGKMGEITKKWGGFLKEAFTDSDRFVVALTGASAPQDEPGKAVLLGAAVALDFDYFEDNNRR